MKTPIFSEQYWISPDFYSKLNQLITLIKDQILPNNRIYELFSLWKKIGFHIAENEFESSQQQQRKKNTSDQELAEIYAIECSLVLLLRSWIFLTQSGEDQHSFRSIESIKANFDSMQRTPVAFLFQNDIYSIWFPAIWEDLSQDMDGIITSNLPSLLGEIAPFSWQQLMFFLHEQCLVGKQRKLLGEFYTPHLLARLIGQMALKSYSPEGSVADFSCGSGMLISEYFSRHFKIIILSMAAKFWV